MSKLEKGLMPPENDLGFRSSFSRDAIGGSEIGITTWDRQKDSYTDEYIAFIEEAIAELR